MEEVLIFLSTCAAAQVFVGPGGGYMKGKSAIHIGRTCLGQRNHYGGMSFWARGCFFSTEGAMRQWFGGTFATKSRKTNVPSISICSSSRPPKGGQWIC